MKFSSYFLGFYYYYDLTKLNHYQLSIDYFLKALQVNEKFTHHFLYYGFSKLKNLDGALQILQQGVYLKDIYCLEIFGKLLCKGKIYRKDIQKGLKFFDEAIKLGSSSARRNYCSVVAEHRIANDQDILYQLCIASSDGDLKSLWSLGISALGSHISDNDQKTGFRNDKNCI